MHELADLAGPYVLAALDPDEQMRFEEHLGACETCRAEINELSAGLDAVFDAAAEPAPVRLRARVLEGIAAPAPTVVPLRRANRRWMVPTLVAAALALIVGFVAVNLVSDPIEAVLEAADAVEVPLEGIDGRVVTAGDTTVLITSSLAPLAADRTYQLWLIDPAGPVPAGVFRPDENGDSAVIVDGVAADGLVLGVTEEPAGGSDQPTGDVIASAEL